MCYSIHLIFTADIHCCFVSEGPLSVHLNGHGAADTKEPGMHL